MSDIKNCWRCAYEYATQGTQCRCMKCCGHSDPTINPDEGEDDEEDEDDFNLADV